jgi:hypothetical protein
MGDQLPIVFTPTIARSSGLSRAQLRRRPGSGSRLAIGRGAYAERHTVEQPLRKPKARYLLDVIAMLQRFGPDAHAALWSAAAAHDLPLPASGGWPVSLVRPTGSARRRPGLSVDVAALPPKHRTKPGLLRATSVARTIVDLGRRAPLIDAVSAADAALHNGLVTKGDLHDVLDFQAGWPGSARAEQVIELADGRSESPLESRSRLRLIQAGLPPPDLQVEIRDEEGAFLARSDFFWSDLGVVGEADGRVKYADGRGRTLWEEKRREDAPRQAGYEVVRWTFEDIEFQLDDVARRFWAAVDLAARRRTS